MVSRLVGVLCMALLCSTVAALEAVDTSPQAKDHAVLLQESTSGIDLSGPLVAAGKAVASTVPYGNLAVLVFESVVQILTIIHDVRSAHIAARNIRNLLMTVTANSKCEVAYNAFHVVKSLFLQVEMSQDMIADAGVAHPDKCKKLIAHSCGTLHLIKDQKRVTPAASTPRSSEAETKEKKREAKKSKAEQKKAPKPSQVKPDADDVEDGDEESLLAIGEILQSKDPSIEKMAKLLATLNKKNETKKSRAPLFDMAALKKQIISDPGFMQVLVSALLSQSRMTENTQITEVIESLQHDSVLVDACRTKDVTLQLMSKQKRQRTLNAHYRQTCRGLRSLSNRLRRKAKELYRSSRERVRLACAEMPHLAQDHKTMKWDNVAVSTNLEKQLNLARSHFVDDTLADEEATFSPSGKVSYLKDDIRNEFALPTSSDAWKVNKGAAFFVGLGGKIGDAKKSWSTQMPWTSKGMANAIGIANIIMYTFEHVYKSDITDVSGVATMAFVDAIKARCQNLHETSLIVAEAEKVAQMVRKSISSISTLFATSFEVGFSATVTVLIKAIYNQYTGDDIFATVGHHVYCVNEAEGRLLKAQDKSLFLAQCNFAKDIALNLMKPDGNPVFKNLLLVSAADGPLNYMKYLLELHATRARAFLQKVETEMDSNGCNYLRYKIQSALARQATFEKLNVKEMADESYSPDVTGTLCKVEDIAYCVAASVKAVCRSNANKVERHYAGSISSVLTAHYKQYRSMYPWKSTVPGVTGKANDPTPGQISERARLVEGSLKSYTSAVGIPFHRWVWAHALRSYGKQPVYGFTARGKNNLKYRSLFQGLLVPLAQGCAAYFETVQHRFGRLDMTHCSGPTKAANFFAKLKYEMLFGNLRWLSTPFYQDPNVRYNSDDRIAAKAKKNKILDTIVTTGRSLFKKFISKSHVLPTLGCPGPWRRKLRMNKQQSVIEAILSHKGAVHQRYHIKTMWSVARKLDLSLTSKRYRGTDAFTTSEVQFLKKQRHKAFHKYKRRKKLLERKRRPTWLDVYKSHNAEAVKATKQRRRHSIKRGSKLKTTTLEQRELLTHFKHIINREYGYGPEASQDARMCIDASLKVKKHVKNNLKLTEEIKQIFKKSIWRDRVSTENLCLKFFSDTYKLAVKKHNRRRYNRLMNIARKRRVRYCGLESGSGIMKVHACVQTAEKSRHPDDRVFCRLACNHWRDSTTRWRGERIAKFAMSWFARPKREICYNRCAHRIRFLNEYFREPFNMFARKDLKARRDSYCAGIDPDQSTSYVTDCKKLSDDVVKYPINAKGTAAFCLAHYYKHVVSGSKVKRWLRKPSCKTEREVVNSCLEMSGFNMRIQFSGCSSKLVERRMAKALKFTGSDKYPNEFKFVRGRVKVVVQYEQYDKDPSENQKAPSQKPKQGEVTCFNHRVPGKKTVKYVHIQAPVKRTTVLPCFKHSDCKSLKPAVGRSCRDQGGEAVCVLSGVIRRCMCGKPRKKEKCKK